jgi:hypothetical protein
MAQSQTTPPNSESTELPTCPNCGSPKWSTWIGIGPDIDKRVFECPVCDISESGVLNIS